MTPQKNKKVVGDGTKLRFFFAENSLLPATTSYFQIVQKTLLLRLSLSHCCGGALTSHHRGAPSHNKYGVEIEFSLSSVPPITDNCSG